MNKIGARIIQVCEALEQLGSCGYNAIAEMTGVQRENVSKYCQRAVVYGLMTVEKPERRGNSGRHNVYTIVPNWRQLLKVKRMVLVKQEEKHQRERKKTTFSGVNSIFGVQL